MTALQFPDPSITNPWTNPDDPNQVWEHDGDGWSLISSTATYPEFVTVDRTYTIGPDAGDDFQSLQQMADELQTLMFPDAKIYATIAADYVLPDTENVFFRHPNLYNFSLQGVHDARAVVNAYVYFQGGGYRIEDIEFHGAIEFSSLTREKAPLYLVNDCYFGKQMDFKHLNIWNVSYITVRSHYNLFFEYCDIGEVGLIDIADDGDGDGSMLMFAHCNLESVGSVTFGAESGIVIRDKTDAIFNGIHWADGTVVDKAIQVLGGSNVRSMSHISIPASVTNGITVTECSTFKQNLVDGSTVTYTNNASTPTNIPVNVFQNDGSAIFNGAAA